MENIERQLQELITQPDWEYLQLASQIIQGLGAKTAHLEALLKAITHLSLEEFLPEMDYHRFACSLTNRYTFEILHHKYNEFLPIPFLEVKVCSEQITLLPYINLPPKPQILELEIEDLPVALFFSLKAQFQIGQKPSN